MELINGPAPRAFSALRAIKHQIKHRVPASLAPPLRQAWATVNQLAFWSGRPLGWTLPSGVKVAIKTQSDWAIYNDVFAGGEYDSALEPLLAADNPLVVDLGANVGFFSLRLADLWQRARRDDRFRVVCVEGSPVTFAQLARNVDQPALKGRCLVHHGLVGQRQGQASISLSVRTGNNSVVSQVESYSRAQVSFLDLEQLLPAGERVALLKVDIEGSEEMFFDNYPQLLMRADRMVVEFHGELCDVPRCLRLIQQAGFPEGQALRRFDLQSVLLFAR